MAKHEHPIGIDFGGTGIKAAPVDLEEGAFAADRERIDTPQPATPEAVFWAIERARHTGAGDRPMPWAEKDMMIVLDEADRARISLPLCGTIKEVIKGIKVERGE